MEIINLEYQYTEAEAIRFRRAGAKTLKYIPLLPLAGALLLLIVILFFMQGRDDFNYSFALAGGFFLVLFPVFLDWSAKKYFRKNPDANKTRRWTIDEQGLKYETEGFEARFVWDRLIRVEETRLGFLLFLQLQAAYWIPKSSFRNDVDMKNFRNLVESHGFKLKD